MSKLTAVQWLHLSLHNRYDDKEYIQEMIRQAKQREREQIMDAYKDCHDLGHIYGLDAENYYNETYGNKDNK